MRWLLVLNGLLLVGLAAAIAGVQVLDRGAASVDASVRRYAAAVAAKDLDAAVAEIAPADRDAWRAWIAGQLGNVYEVRGVAVRAPAVVAREAHQPTDVTVVMDVNRGFADEFYQPTTRVDVEHDQGRWYLKQPLLAPEALEEI